MLVSVRPRLGILDFGPIQYHTPLYQRLGSRANVELDVLFLSDNGLRPMMDKLFGVEISWDTDLLSGYSHRFLAREEEKPSVSALPARSHTAVPHSSLRPPSPT